MNKTKETNPAYGMIRITRRQGGAKPLFGSSIKHNETIGIQISNGSVTRDLHTDFYIEDKQIIDIELSPTQFADAITEIGSAFPCTIRWQKDTGSIPMPEFKNKKTQFTEEFNNNVRASAAKSVEILDNVKELFQKKSLTKTDREEILRQLSQLQMAVTSHNEFLAECFNEQIERTTVEAKGEIEAFWQQKLNDIALAAISHDLKQQELDAQAPILLEDDK